MSNTRPSLPLEFDFDDQIFPARSRGPLGWLDAGSPELYADRGDSPGTIGYNDFSSSLGQGPLARIPGSSLASAQANLSPSEFADRYHHLRISYMDSQSGLLLANSVVINVHRYNNAGIARRRANFREKSQLVQRVRRELRRAGGLTLIDVESNDRSQIAKAFYGKGSPEDFAVTLGHALRYRRTTPAGLQNYCDNQARLGLDCSGFVNQYFMLLGLVPGPQGIGITTYESQGTVRTNPGEIQAHDVLIWQGGQYRHIAVIDHLIPGSDPLQFAVVESSGSMGLATNTYTIVASDRGNVFRVDRGIDARTPSRVKIFAVNAR